MSKIKPKYNRAESISFILYYLLTNKKIEKTFIMKKLFISRKQMYRYIKDLKNFFAEFKLGYIILSRGENYELIEI